MQPLRAITIEFNLKDALTSMFISYIGITAKSKDKIVAQSLTNVFATNAHYQQNSGPTTVYNNFDIAFAVGLAFQLIVEQNIELLEYIDQTCSPQANEKQKYALTLLKYIVYQLDKRDPSTYLNNIFANKNIPAQPLDNKGINLSKIYTFVHLCELGALFKQFQAVIKFKFWNSFSNQDVNQAEIQEAQLFFYQPSAAFPILVLIKENFDEIQRKIFEHHTIYIKNVAIQMILDAVHKQPSQTIQNLQFQPFKFASIQELAAVIFGGQPNYSDRVAKFLKINSVEKTFAFLILAGTSFNACLQAIKAEQEQQTQEDLVQQEVGGQGLNSSQNFDPFKTCVPVGNQDSNLRKTISY